MTEEGFCVMSEAVTIPKEEYETLLRCKEIVESDFEEGFSESFVRKIRLIEADVASGRKISFRNKDEMNRHLEQL